MAHLKSQMLFKKFELVKRHLRNSARHITVKKLKNLLRNEFEFRMKKTNLSSLPYFIKVEPTPFCHLNCPNCAYGRAGSKREYTNKKMMLSFDNFKQIIDPLSDVLFAVSLSAHGEPLLNPQLMQMISYCQKKNIGTEFPTNFSMKLSADQIEQLVISGLDHLLVSIDGTTQDVYEKYRRGGNLSLVLKNSSALIAAKKRLKSKIPFIEFKFILFEHNRHQLADAERLSQKMGFDKFSVVLDAGSSEKKNIANQARIENMAKKSTCFWPWNNMIIYWDGKVCPCCFSNFDMGTVPETPVTSIWNNDKYQKLRSFFNTLDPSEQEDCYKCMKF